MNRNKLKKGMTLIETVISLAIIAIVVLLFMNLFSSASNILGKAINKNKDSMVAQSSYEAKLIPSKVLKSEVTATVTLDGIEHSVIVDVNEYTSNDISYQGVVIHE